MRKAERDMPPVRQAGWGWGWTSQPSQPIPASSHSQHPPASSKCAAVQKMAPTNCYSC